MTEKARTRAVRAPCKSDYSDWRILQGLPVEEFVVVVVVEVEGEFGLLGVVAAPLEEFVIVVLVLLPRLLL